MLLKLHIYSGECRAVVRDGVDDDPGSQGVAAVAQTGPTHCTYCIVMKRVAHQVAIRTGLKLAICIRKLKVPTPILVTLHGNRKQCTSCGHGDERIGIRI